MEKVKFCFETSRGEKGGKKKTTKKCEEKDKKFSPHIGEVTVGRKKLPGVNYKGNVEPIPKHYP